MRESNTLVSISGFLNIFLGVWIMYIQLAKNINYIGIDFILYLVSGISFVIGVLTLFRENRRKNDR